MTAEYRVTILDKSGRAVAYINDYISLNVAAAWVDKGSYQLTLSGFDRERIEKFAENNQIVVDLIDPGIGITAWVRIFSGFVKTYAVSLSQDGQRMYQSFGPSLEELLAKEQILWYSGSPQASKSGAVATVMREYARENIGELAVAANGRDADGVVSGLAFYSDGSGPQWSGAKSRKGLLRTMQELRAYSVDRGDPVDFRIVDLGGYRWRFESGKLGVDRTTRGLNPATGRNAAGNTPVVFSDGFRNIERYMRSYNAANGYNQIVALGNGEGVDRAVAVAVDGLSVAASPIARRSRITTSNTDNPDELLSAAREELAINRPRVQFNFEPRDSRFVFNRDYFLGDYITAQDGGDEFHKQVISVTYNVTAGSNSVVTRNIYFADV